MEFEAVLLWEAEETARSMKWKAVTMERDSAWRKRVWEGSEMGEEEEEDDDDEEEEEEEEDERNAKVSDEESRR